VAERNKEECSLAAPKLTREKDSYWEVTRFYDWVMWKDEVALLTSWLARVHNRDLFFSCIVDMLQRQSCLHFYTFMCKFSAVVLLGTPFVHKIIVVWTTALVHF
jgi:hypothetical protein